MRFARHARIYRGPLDAAPLAGVAFLLILFLLLNSLVYTPGALVRLPEGAEPPANSDRLELTKKGTLLFRGATYTNLADARAALTQIPLRRVNLVTDSGADPAVARVVSGWFDVNLPSGKELAGASNPAVIVAVNFRGETSFENRLRNENELRALLHERLQSARSRNSDLTLTLAMDKDTPIKVYLHLVDLAQSIGFKEVALGEQP